jgi:DNA topoisomerase-1
MVDHPTHAAKLTDLRYVNDSLPGIRRVALPRDRGFAYETADGRRASDAGTLSRIEALHIPPAWGDVWICGDPLGHLQATGRDARGRKQYRYHDDWRRLRDQTKFDRMESFGSQLTRIRASVDDGLSGRALSRERVLAAVVGILDDSLVRVGNQDYLRDNGSYGLTTLQDRHAAIAGARIRFEFRGKSGKEHTLTVYDSRLARVVKRCRDLPGQTLFQFVDAEGVVRQIGSGDVNAYLQETTGEDFTSKDFRTWGGTAAFVRELLAKDPPESPEVAEKNVIDAVREAACALGNTPAVCRRSYIHPGVIEHYVAGQRPTLREAASGCRSAKCKLLDEGERALLGLLKALA